MTSEVNDGFYPDPFDPAIERRWSSGRWTARVRINGDETFRPAEHVLKSLPRPGDASVIAIIPTQAPPTPQTASNPALAIAVVWTVFATIVGCVFIFSTINQTYGGAAYTGIQNTGADTVRALGFLIISTGPIGLILALSRR